MSVARRTQRIAFFVFLLLGQIAVQSGVLQAQTPDCDKRLGEPLRVMTYNIRIGRGTVKRGMRPPWLALERQELGPVIDTIRSLNPDVVALQEVLGAAQAEKIAEALNMHVRTAIHPSIIPWWGVSVLSRCPVRVLSEPVLSKGIGNAKRALIAEVLLQDGAVAVASVHKDVDLVDGASLKRLTQAAHSVGLPLVLAGDFNMRPKDKRLGLLGKGWVDTATAIDTTKARHARKEGTFVSRNTRRIDYIFVQSNRFDVFEVEIADKRFDTASDHRAYMATIRLKR